MAATPTTNIPLGFRAPDFNLPNIVNGKTESFDSLKGQYATVVMFICNHCPFVIHVIDELVQLANDYQHKGIGFIAINSNDIEAYPEDNPEKMKEFANTHKFPFAYLFDETQDIAKEYDAACTPDFSVFDKTDKCVYRGQLDDSRPRNGIPVTGKSLRKTLDLILSDKPIPIEQKPSIGCNIKWKK